MTLTDATLLGEKRVVYLEAIVVIRITWISGAASPEGVIQ